jgi:hypothetical protein
MKIKRFSAQKFLAFLGTPQFFWIIICLLVMQALWIALSGRYPMAFDEDFHLGVIKLYSHHLSPFWDGHPSGGDAFGAVARDPSYLYHYLMSFPFRLVSALTMSQTAQVLILRLINIGMFASALPLYRRLLAKTGASKALVNFSLLLLLLVPITPLLAAQINYDNLLLPLVALIMLMTLKLARSLKAGEINLGIGLGLLSLCLLASVVKYAFLPMFVAIVGFLINTAWRAPRSKKILKLNKWMYLGLVAGLLLSGGLFIERYGVNVLRYHKPVADCAEVLDYEHCQYYGPWIRDYNFEVNKPADSDHSPIEYTQHWFYGMWFRSFFAVDGPATLYQTRGPLVVPGVSAIIFASLGGVVLVLSVRRLWRRHDHSALVLFTAVTLLYLVVLWLQDYQLFIKTAQPVAINGRYLLPVLPFIILVTSLAVSLALGRHRQLKAVLAGVVIICSVWGGGALTYILRSNDAWYWQHTPLKTANHAIQSSLGPITPGYNQPTQFLH